jgi:hypothetical protein
VLVSPHERAESTGHPSAGSGRLTLPAPSFDHLRALTTVGGLWEHARISAPRIEHGFCTEDNARALLVVARDPAALVDLAAVYLHFVLEARTPSGGFRNRRNAAGDWTDEIGSDDSQGRAWWGLGVAARMGPTATIRNAARGAFATCATFDSPHLRANAYAALGAAALLEVDHSHPAATELLRRTSAVIAGACRQRIPWPETRLTYDNARLPEALLAAGVALDDEQLVALGLRLLEWLVRTETRLDHFSFAATIGWEPGDSRPGFDQQPLEAWAMADACHRAWVITGEEAWKARATRAARWLLGDNDTGMALYDTATGATGDGLMVDSVNQNRGAESTLAGIAALQIAELCGSRAHRRAIS